MARGGREHIPETGKALPPQDGNIIKEMTA